MNIYKYVLLGTTLLVTQPSVAAVIELGPGCNLYNAIRAANLDRRVDTCRPGRGADRIIVGYRYSEPPRSSDDPN